jgi:uncharacterized surface protein with fasciclin (FAS1) repeats
MKRKFWKHFVRQVLFASTMLIGLFMAISCEDKYTYDEKEPDFLGANIYDYLKQDGNYTNFVKLIEDAGYQEILTKSGSKTLFVASDSTFEKFYEDNPWGVKIYDELSKAQKSLLINYCMINNAYLIETLNNYNTGGNNEGSLVLGQAMRRSTAVEVIDTVPFLKGDELPNGVYWNKYKEKGIYLLKDQTSWPIVYFFQKMMDTKGMKNEDFEAIYKITRQANDAYIFDKKIIKRDITCKNGYIHVLNGVLLPPKNMADYIQDAPDLTIFGSILDRFCAPYYNQDLTFEYRDNHPGSTDSVFVKRFYSKLGSNVDGEGPVISTYPDNKSIDGALFLPFDPGWNSYHYINFSVGINLPLQSDMGVMIIPDDIAMDAYFNSEEGSLLKNRFGTLSNVPANIIVMLLKKHMRNSFFTSLPSRFPDMLDNDGNNYDMNINDIKRSYIGVNGLVYVTNRVYPPIDFESVYGPVLLAANTRVFDWIIRNPDYKYRFYLNSKSSRYSFMVPTDEFLKDYIDPFTISQNVQGALKFFYDTVALTVKANVYKYDKLTRTVGDSVNTISDANFIANRLLKILDNQLVIGDFSPGKKVYLTKGNSTIWVNGTGTDMTIEGGGDLLNGQKVHVKSVFNQVNGTTYFIDKPLQTSLRSIYEILSTTNEFNEFFELLVGFPSPSNSEIFVNKASYYGSNYVVRFLNNYHYTIYVPTNQAVQDAITSGIIIPWVSQPGIVGINDMVLGSQQQKDAILKLERFLRYHFQDNSVSVSGSALNSQIYQTAAVKVTDDVTHFNTFKNKYYKIGVSSSGSDLTLNTETNGTVNVVTQNNLYNIYASDYIFNGSPAAAGDVTGSLPAQGGITYPNSRIETNSSCVIHQVDKVLLFE